jgi:uncharacterized membrane protein YqaE (UPF0057 family)
MILLDLFLPWISFLMRGKIFAGIVALILQITILGWLPATIWAIVARNSAKNEEKLKKMENRIIASTTTNE